MGKHKEWRKIAKKLRRKRIRTKKAQERDNLLKIEKERLKASPRYQAWLQEQEALEEFRLQEEERQGQDNHRKWLQEEEAAQIAWSEKQIRIALAKEEKERQILLLKEKMQEEEIKKQKALDKQKEETERAQLKKESVKKAILDYINGILNELPSELCQVSQSQPGKEECPFFSKVGACRFFESCSRNHKRPGVSKVLLFQGLYHHFSLSNATRAKEYDTDISLEYDNSETYTHFDEFFKDLISEIKLIGKIKLVKVCKNSEPHLRGNVYVQFRTERDALRVYSSLCGRYYAGKQLSPVFVTIPSWKIALCGQQWNKRCHKGSLCNFLHVFSNPNGEFSHYDEKMSNSDSPKNRWSSESPEERKESRSSRSHYKRSQSTERSSRRVLSQHSYRDKLSDRYKNPEQSCTYSSRRAKGDDYSRARHKNGQSSRRKRNKSSNHSKKHCSSDLSTAYDSAPGWSSDDDIKIVEKKKSRKKSKKSRRKD